MESNERVVTDGGDEEEEHVNRLIALLHEPGAKEGSQGSGEGAGDDRRTVAARVDGGEFDMADEGSSGAGAPGGRRLCCRPSAGAKRCAGATGAGVGEGAPQGPR